MITKEKYLEAKKVICQYKSENNIKAGRPKKNTLPENEMLIFIKEIFILKKEYSYSELIWLIMDKSMIGVTLAKNSLTEIKNKNLITQKNGCRGKYSLK